MKLCLINNLYPPHARGGAEQVVYKTVQGLLRAGHKVVVITTAPGGAHKWQENNLTVYRFQPWNLFFYTNAHKYSVVHRALWHLIDMFHFGAAKHVKNILQTEAPNVVHTHNLMGVSFLVPKVIRKLGIRHLHTVHDVQLVEPSGIILKQSENSWRYSGVATKLYTGLMKRLVGSPNVVISPSQFLLDFYEKRSFFEKSKRVVLRNPVSQVEQTNLEQRFENEVLNFLYLGQIEEHKGVLFLVEVFRMFQNKKAVLHIAGTGSKLGSIKNIALKNSENIIVHGKVDRADLAKLFSKTDVLVVPSLCYENSPTVIFESFSFGVPVLASRVEGVAELINEGENGKTFETGDELDLKKKLEWCFEHRGQLDEMSKKTNQSLIGLSQADYIDTLTELYENK
jgi:glycosyltransferase involved in cell wall biosynthesis